MLENLRLNKYFELNWIHKHCHKYEIQKSELCIWKYNWLNVCLFYFLDSGRRFWTNYHLKLLDNKPKIPWLKQRGYSSFCYPPASEASRGVYWSQAQKNFTHLYTEYPWVSETLWLCGHFQLFSSQLVCIDGPIGH